MECEPAHLERPSCIFGILERLLLFWALHLSLPVFLFYFLLQWTGGKDTSQVIFQCWFVSVTLSSGSMILGQKGIATGFQHEVPTSSNNCCQSHSEQQQQSAGAHQTKWGLLCVAIAAWHGSDGEWEGLRTWHSVVPAIHIILFPLVVCYCSMLLQ